MIREFDDIIGHANIKDYLSNKIENGVITDILMFVGTPGIGKTSIAKRVALALQEDKSDKDRILKGEDTENVKFFNMSILKSDEEVKKVCAQFTKPIAGKKVLILDECHGMTQQQQDSLLTQLENLPENLYVIFCTTEVSKMREALLSRIKLTLHFNKLSRAELKDLTKKLVFENRIQFTSREDIAITNICKFADGDARIIQNIITELSTFDEVTNETLETIIGSTAIKDQLNLLQLLDCDLLQGFAFINSLNIDNQFKDKCCQLLSILCGTLDNTLNTEDTKILNSLNPINYKLYCDFLADVINIDRINIPKLISLFYRYSNKSNGTGVNPDIEVPNIVIAQPTSKSDLDSKIEVPEFDLSMYQKVE